MIGSRSFIAVALAALMPALPPTWAEETLRQQEELDVQPKPLSRLPPVYPYNMRQAGLSGRVDLEFIITTRGEVENPRVVSSNNPWFERPAIDSVLKWKFVPGQVGGQPVKVLAHQRLDFIYHDAAPNGLWAVPTKRKEVDLPPELLWDKPPQPVSTAFPVFPFQDLKMQKAGRTKIKFLVGRDGKIAGAQVMEATTPEMGLAALAMIDTWVFTPPAKQDGTPCSALLSIDHSFKPFGDGDVPVMRESRDILRLLEKSPEKIPTLAQLDRIPKPLSQRPPVYPTGLLKAGQSGEAMIEFIIDKKGDAQLPRIVSCTAPEFGYAAAQAIATWRYEPPLKDGKPAIARVQIPLQFKMRN